MYNKKLSIILLYYKEPVKLIKPMLDSLEKQIGFDWNDIELLICSSVTDGGDVDLSSYPNLSKISKRYKYDAFAPGPGASWQIGMDNAEGEYLWRLDIDDVLVDRFAIYYILHNLKKYNDPKVLILSCIGPDGLHNASEELPAGVPIPMAPFLWVIRSDIVKKDNIRLFPYTMVWEDVNFTTLLWDNVDMKGIPPSSEEFIYEHFDRKDSTFYTQYRYKPLKSIQENYFQLIHSVKTYERRGVPVPTQVFCTFLMAFGVFYHSIVDEHQKEQALKFLRILVQKYPFIMLFLIKRRIDKGIWSDIYNRCILIQVTENTTKENLYKLLEDIEIQKESESFNLSKTQIICYGAVSKIRECNLSKDFPALYPNIILSEFSKVSDVFTYFIISEGMALSLNADTSKLSTWDFIDNWFKNSYSK